MMTIIVGAVASWIIIGVYGAIRCHRIATTYGDEKYGMSLFDISTKLRVRIGEHSDTSEKKHKVTWMGRKVKRLEFWIGLFISGLRYGIFMNMAASDPSAIRDAVDREVVKLENINPD